MLDLKLRLVSVLIALTALVIFCLVFDYFRLLRRPWRLGLYFGVLGIIGAGVLMTNAVLPTSLMYGDVYYQGSQAEKRVALTFDDGPNPPYTLQILDILSRHDVEATFFLIGKNVEKYPEVAREIVERGHRVGNHSFTHPDLLKMNAEQIAWEIDATTEIIERETGIRPTLFRPPHGFKDPVVLDKARERKLHVVQWTLIARDWKNPGVEQIADRIVSRIQNGSIILLHDGDGIVNGGDRSQTVAATEMIITQLQKAGYSFVTVDELLKDNREGTSKQSR